MRSEVFVLIASLSTCLAQAWTYQGCYLDSTTNRQLRYRSTANDAIQTVDTCTNYCGSQGYSWSGLEYGNECYCDHQLVGATKEPDSDCSMPCKGNSSQTCGNGYRLSVYSTGEAITTQATNPGPSGWTLLGCYTDSTSSRSLRYGQSVTGAMTVAKCTSACQSAGWPLAGVEYASECYCDSSIQSPGKQTDSGCDMACAGNASEFCGGGNRLNIYQSKGNSDPGLPSGWTALGCYVDNTNARTLPMGQAVAGGASNMTIDGCIRACGAQGFSYSGVEYGQECYCGNSLQNGGACATDQTTCNMACQGNRAQICGGSYRLNLFHLGSGGVTCGSGSTTTTKSTSTTLTSTTRSTTAIGSSVSTSTTTTSALSTTTTRSSTASTTPSASSSSTTTSTQSSTVPSSSTTSSVSTSSSATALSTTPVISTTSTTSTTTSATPSSTVCPDFWTTVVADLAANMRTNGQCNNISRAAVRYAFHDAGSYSKLTPFYPPAAGGADGSLLLSADEINRPDHDGLRDYHAVIRSWFSKYKAAGYAITAADLIQVAGSVGVLACPGGRPGFTRVGRQDTTQAAPDGLLPQAFGPGSDHNTILQMFVDKGFSARDLAALLGAHSTSIANFQTQNGIPAGTPQDTTPQLWDVEYYNETYYPPPGIGRFASDINLAANESRTAVGFQFRSFVGKQAQWQASFASAFFALSVLGVPGDVKSAMQDCTNVVNAAFG